MVDRFAKIAGLTVFLIGLLGFLYPVTHGSKLFGLFQVDPIHNIVHLISGALLFAIGFSENCLLIRRFVLAFAAVYGFIAILGFFTPVVFGMHVNMADNLLHLTVAAGALLFALPEHHITSH